MKTEAEKTMDLIIEKLTTKNKNPPLSETMKNYKKALDILDEALKEAYLKGLEKGKRIKINYN